jgi:hypothetical protein
MQNLTQTWTIRNNDELRNAVNNLIKQYPYVTTDDLMMLLETEGQTFSEDLVDQYRDECFGFATFYI